MGTANTATIPSGVPIAIPIYMVDATGVPFSATNSLPVNVSLTATSVAIEDGTTPTQKLAVDASGRISVLGITNALPAGTNVVGHVIVDTTSTTAVTQATGSNLHAVLDAGSAIIGSTTIQATSGTALVADQSNTELRASLYVTKSVAGDTALTLGSATSANSVPTVIASDQGAVPIKRSAVAVYSLASTATTSSSNSGDLTVGPYTEISLDINTTAQTGTNPTVQFTYSRKGADGIYYALWQSAVLTVAANTLSTSIGAGVAYNQSLGSTGQLKWVIGGSATPGFTFSANISGK